MSKVTIKDIAREAGVSISTVSNALNGVDVLKPETRDHILEVADRLHYIPNLNGKNLKSKSTNTIGLFATSLKGPYFTTLVDSLARECVKYGYELNIFVTCGGRTAITNILGRRVDGCIIFSEDVDEKDAKQIQKYEVPTVFLDRETKSSKSTSVIIDSYQDGLMVAEHLMSKGARKMAYIQGIPSHRDAVERLRGFRDGLKKANIELDPVYILQGEFDQQVTHDSVIEFLEKGLPLPDAFFACNDTSAFGCIDALTEKGYQIPRDTMVIGVDDIELSAWYSPKLTTIKTGYEKIATVATSKLMRMINEEVTEDVTKFHGHLIERESTAIIE